jgi:hypothetical protein
MTTKKLAAVAALTLLAGIVKAACTYPPAPDKMPDGNTATKEEMLAAKQAVSKYNDDITAYQNCIKLETDDSIAELQKNAKTDEEKKAVETKKAEMDRKLVERNNAALDEVTAVVEQFNEQLRAYNKKNPPAAKK